jgi:hypothetical protein
MLASISLFVAAPFKGISIPPMRFQRRHWIAHLGMIVSENRFTLFRIMPWTEDLTAPVNVCAVARHAAFGPCAATERAACDRRRAVAGGLHSMQKGANDRGLNDQAALPSIASCFDGKAVGAFARL